MALPDPRVLPDCLLRPVKFKLDFTPLGQMSRTAGGEVSFQEKVGGGQWQLSLESRPLNETDYGTAHGFFLSLQGGAKAFKAYDLRRCYPIAYGPGVLGLARAAGGAFDGTCTLTAGGGSAVSLSGLPANFTLSVGDYLSFPWRGAQRLVKAVETLTGNGSGVLSGLNIQPWLVAGGTTGVTVALVRAWCLMRPVPGSWSGDRTNRDPVSFQAIEAPN